MNDKGVISIACIILSKELYSQLQKNHDAAPGWLYKTVHYNYMIYCDALFRKYVMCIKRKVYIITTLYCYYNTCFEGKNKKKMHEPSASAKRVSFIVNSFYYIN